MQSEDVNGDIFQGKCQSETGNGAQHDVERRPAVQFGIKARPWHARETYSFLRSRTLSSVC